MSRLDTFIRFPLAAAMLAAMSTVAGAGGGETKKGTTGGSEDGIKVMGLNEVPREARESISKEADGAQVEAVSQVTDEGTTTYTAEAVKQGRMMQIEVGATGEVRSVEIEVIAQDLPVAVKRTVDGETLGYPRRTFSKRVRDGKTTYLATAATAMRGKVLEIDDQGKIVSRELRSV